MRTIQRYRLYRRLGYCPVGAAMNAIPLWAEIVIVGALSYFILEFVWSLFK